MEETHVIYFDRPTANGRTYSGACFASLPSPLLVTMGVVDDTTVSLDACCGTVDKIEIGDDRATIIWTALATPAGRMYAQRKGEGSDPYSLSPVGIGKVDDGIVHDYALSYFALIPIVAFAQEAVS